jgi:hypothetical protein
MPNIIKIKRSNVAGSTPTLSYGELGYNAADNRLFAGSAANQAVVVGAGGSGGGGSANIVEATTAAGFPATGSAGTLYHATDAKRIYFWDASGVYVEAGPSGGGGSSGLSWSSVPASPTATGAAGSIAYDTAYLYAAVSQNLWRRAAWQVWGLLDLVPSAAAAYSLRNLSGNASAAVVRVRRSSDSTEQDFTGAEILNGTLAAFVGAGNDGFVRTWYDQSGNARHAGQATTSLQPAIVSSGSVVLLNGKPAIDWPSSSADRVLTSTISTKSAITTLAVFSAAKRAGGYGKIFNLGADSETSGGALTPITGASFQDWSENFTLLLTNGYLSSRTSKIMSTANVIASSATTQNMLFAAVSSSVARMFVNKTEVSYSVQSTGNVSTLTDAPFYLGNGSNGSQQLIGRMQEVVIWTADKFSSRATAEAEVGSYYGI